MPPEDFDAIKNHLTQSYAMKHITDKNVISYALYPKVYDDYCDYQEYYNDVSQLESHIFFYGLAKGEETSINIGEGKDLLIKYVDGYCKQEYGIDDSRSYENGNICLV